LNRCRESRHEHAYHAVSTRFLGPRVASDGGWRSWRAGIARGRSAAGDNHDPVPQKLGHLRRPRYLAGDLLRAEGFTDVQYITGLPFDAVARGQLDFEINTAAWAVSQLDADKPITVLAGVHPGCYELFAHEPIGAVSDLRDRKVGIRTVDSSEHLLLAIMAAHVGLDPQNDINWIVRPGEVTELFAEREIDAFLGFPPEPQEMRARKIGRVILNMTTDKPWSQYICCIACANRDFVRNYPIASKRALRAILKATDICATAPELAARQLVDGEFTERYDIARQILTEVPYGAWREFDPEDSMRFYALRLNEVDMIQSSPNALIAEGTDWRFVNELKRELKG
jgi:NitT/TauT family transport system substrate-binding protein